MKTTLVAVSGMSPAILTETLWALAGESPAIIPDEVVVITTAVGEEELARSLLTKRRDWGNRTVWESLRTQLLKKSNPAMAARRLQLSVRVVELPDEVTGVRTKAPDLRTGTDHDEAADLIVRTLAPLCDAEDNAVIASIAGGRKTMGALLYAAMSLLGKESDRVTHVLVSEPYEECRDFFFPDQPFQDLEVRRAETHPIRITARDARIELADLPFVALRNRFEELNEPRRTFAGLVERYSRSKRAALPQPPRVSLDAEAGLLSVEGRPMRLTGRDLVVAAFLLHRARAGLPHLRDRSEATPLLRAFVLDWKRLHPTNRATARLSGDLNEDDLTKGLAGLRAKLRSSGLEGAVAHLVPKRDRIGFEIAPES
jgi:CRISPR-associated protein (TIGR02584 family)